MTDKGITLTARLLKELAASITAIGESYTGVCNSGMAASQITIVCDDLKDFGDDYFNDGWLMYIAHNDDAPGTAPESETQDITDYVSTTGTFTTAAFSANVEEDDVVIVARVTTFIIDQVKLIVSPTDGSLASFISSGNGSTSYGSRIGIDKSIVDAIGHNGVTTLGSGIYGNIGDFAGQANLQTLLASLGIPDVAAKPLYTCLIDDRLDNGTFGLAALDTDLDGVKAKTDLMNSALGTSTLNDANTSDTIVPGSLPTNMHVVFDISSLNNNGDDFDLEVKVGVAASERVVAYYNLTSDGTDITIDTGSSTGSIVKQRKIDISNILVYTGEQVIVELTKNGAADRDVVYKYICGV